MAASLSLLIIALGIPAILFSVSQTVHEPAAQVARLLSLPGLAVSYALLRSRRPGLGGGFLLLAIAVPLWGLWLEAELGGQESPLVYFLVIPILLAPMLLGFRWAFAFVVGHVIAVALVHRIVHGWALFGPAESAQQAVFFLNVFVGAIAVLAAYQFEDYLGIIEEREGRLRAANERLADVDRTRLHFVNTIAHDLATPLSPIGIQVHLLRSGGDLSPVVERALGIIQRNLDQLGRLVQDLGDVGKLESGNLKLVKRAADLGRVARDVTDSFAPLAASRGVALEVAAPDALAVEADETRLAQVLTNFVTNALKFTPTGGTVRVEAARRGDMLRAAVRDSGRGLTAEEMGRLFQPFSQVHAPGEIPERGTGLGLFICKRIIEQHGGTVGVESPGRGLGSTFWFSIPAR